MPYCCREHNPEADICDWRQIEVLALAWLGYGSRKVRCAIQHAIALLEDCMPDGMGAMPLIVSLGPRNSESSRRPIQAAVGAEIADREAGSG